MNCSSSVRSFWKLLRKSMSFVWFFKRISMIGCVLLGLATNTCKKVKEHKREAGTRVRGKHVMPVFTKTLCIKVLNNTQK